MQFTTSLYPDRVHYVDIVLGSTADIVQKYFTRIDHNTWKLQGAAADKAVELLSSPLRTLGLGVLEMEHYTTLMSYLSFSTRKQVALSMVKAIVEEKKPISSVEAATRLFNFISPLIKDEDDTPESEGNDKETFAAEQQSVARLVHMIQTDDLDKEVQILTAMRNFFGQGGPKRLVYTLSPTYYGAISLIVKLLAFEGTPAPAVTLKKLFQFLHKTASALVSIAREEKAAAEIALQLWLVSASISDRVDKTCGEPGSFELICDEFLRQALITYEEEISDSTRQFQSIISMVGTLLQITALDPENLDNISAKITQHAARLLKKPLQFRAVSTCSHLFWSSARRDGKRVVECLQKCLNIVRDVVQADPTQVILWVEMLDKYIYYFEIGCEEVAGKFINIILGLCVEHITHAAADASSQNEAKKAKAHLQQTVEYLKMQKSSSNPEVAARFAEVSIDGV
jgi:vacuolar protein sorting-associated protein 35